MEKNCRNCGYLVEIVNEKAGECWRWVPANGDLGPAEEIVRLDGFCRFWKPTQERRQEGGRG